MTLAERLTKALTLVVEGEEFLLRTSKDAESQRLLDIIWDYINHVGLPKPVAPVAPVSVKRDTPPATFKEVKL